MMGRGVAIHAAGILVGAIDMKAQTQVILLSVKYWLQGDDWKFAYSYAKAIIYGFKDIK